MNCRTFGENLHLLAGGTPPGALWAAAQVHAAGCPRCRKLLDAATGGLGGDGADGGEALTESILERTVGGACARAEEKLGSWIDGSLARGDADWIERHLDGCSGCRELAAALRALGADLPSMAEVAPDARFLRDVLRETIGKERERSTSRIALAAGWRRLMRRPRIAQEAAYCAAMVLLLLAGGRVGAGRGAAESPAGPGLRTPAQAAMGFAQGVEDAARFADRFTGDLSSLARALRDGSRSSGGDTTACEPSGGRPRTPAREPERRIP